MIQRLILAALLVCGIAAAADAQTIPPSAAAGALPGIVQPNRINLGIDQRTAHGDSIYTILATDHYVVTSTALTAARVWTLPAASAVNAGDLIIVADEAGGVTGTNTLTVARAGSDTINGGTSVVIPVAYGAVGIKSDGVSKWTLVSDELIQAFTCTTHEFTTALSASGVFTCTQPAASDISGSISAAQMLALTSAHLYVGNGSNVPGDVAMSGDATLANTGAISVAKVGGDANVAFLDVNQVFSKSQRATLQTISISTSTFTPNFDTGADFSVTLVHASCPCTLANPSTTPVAGQHGVIYVIQSSTGSDTIGTWGSQYLSAGGTSTITLSTGANAIDVLSYAVKDSTHIVLSMGAANVSH